MTMNKNMTFLLANAIFFYKISSIDCALPNKCNNTQLANNSEVYQNVIILVEKNFGDIKKLEEPLDDNNITLQCEGFLVATQWIITSFFCPIDPSWTCIVGSKHVSLIDVSPEQIYYVKTVIYSQITNLMLVKLDRKLEFKVTMPVIGGYSTNECFIISWSARQFSNQNWTTPSQMFAYFKPISDQQCSTKYDLASTYLKTSSGSFCLEQLYGKECNVKLCSYDVGAPVVCDDKFVGVITNVSALNNSNCEAKNDNPQKFYFVTAINPHRQWIEYFTEEKYRQQYKSGTGPNYKSTTVVVNTFVFFLKVIYSISD